MPTFGRTGTGKWHVVGPDGCRYGRAFADDPDDSLDVTVTATDIVAYDPPPPPAERDPSSVSAALSPGGDTGDQRLVLPTAMRESESDLCRSCRSTLERHQRPREKLVGDLKRVTTVRDPDWIVTDRDDRRACDWCRAREATTHHSDALRCTVCPACARLFETGLGEPDDEEMPETDTLPATPEEPVDAVVLGTTLPEDDPAELVGSNRPVVEYREKHTYADIVYKLERTGHALDADGIAALDGIREAYADRVAGDESHQTDVTLDVDTVSRTVSMEGIRPDDRVAMIEDCREVVSNPAYWFPVGWPDSGRIYRRSFDGSIPGDDSIVDAFPRLQTRTPSTERSGPGSQSVDVESLRAVTDPGRYERGERYYRQGAVTDVDVVDDRLEATVQGSRPYDVRATLSDGRFVDGECSCPDDAPVCKHVVAAVLASGDVDADVAGSGRSLEDVLDSASADELRELLRDLAEEEVSVRKRVYDELGGE